MATRKARARELLKTAERGPAFDEDNSEAFRVYRMWSTSWLLPALARLIPELKGVTLPPCGSQKRDQFWEDRTFVGNSGAVEQKATE